MTGTAKTEAGAPRSGMLAAERASAPHRRRWGAPALISRAPGRVNLIMDASHISLRDDYQVSGPALDQITEIARRSPGCLGARMTGGGFAGCAVALVRTERADEFCSVVIDQFRKACDLEATIWLCEPAAGGST